MLKIAGVPKAYAWGSTEAIQLFLGAPMGGRPLAEIWYGSHPTAPTAPSPVEGRGTTLDSEISRDTIAMLGAEVLGRFGELPSC